MSVHKWLMNEYFLLSVPLIELGRNGNPYEGIYGHEIIFYIDLDDIKIQF